MREILGDCDESGTVMITALGFDLRGAQKASKDFNISSLGEMSSQPSASAKAEPSETSARVAPKRELLVRNRPVPVDRCPKDVHARLPPKVARAVALEDNLPTFDTMRRATSMSWRAGRGGGCRRW